MYDFYQGTGHWIVGDKCIELSGTKVGNQEIDHALYQRISKGDPPKLNEGLCLSAGYDKRTDYFSSEEKILVSTYVATKPIPICKGGFAYGDGISNWNTMTPYSADASACLDRCAKRKECKFI